MSLENLLPKYKAALKVVVTQLKEEHNMTQMKIIEKCKANGLHMSQSTISDIINERCNPSLSTLIAIASTFDTSVTTR